MNLVKKGTRINSMSNYELVGEWYIQWSGAADMNKSGESGNSRAVKLEEACVKRFGDTIWNGKSYGDPESLCRKIMAKGEEVTNRIHPSVVAQHPNVSAYSRLVNYKVALLAAPEVLEYIKEEVKKL